MSNEKQAPDWEAIKLDYETTSKSIREIARWNGISDTAIRKRAKAEEWRRQENQASSQREPEASSNESRSAATRSYDQAKPEEIVSHGRSLTLRMLDELETSTRRVGDLEMMIDTAIDGDDRKGQREALMQAISLKQRAEVLKALATAAKTFSESGAVVGKKAERQASAERATASGGKFAPPSAPKVVVDNTR